MYELPETPSDAHMLKLAQFVVDNLRVDVMAADTHICWPAEAGDLCVEVVLGEILEMSPEGPWTDPTDPGSREFSTNQREYARKCLKALGAFLNTRVRVISL